MLSDGRRIETETVVWTAGVAANPVAARLGLPLDERGRVPVDELCASPGCRGVYALGDIAAVPNAATPGELDPPTCQHALRQARRLARNLRGARSRTATHARARWPRSAAATASPSSGGVRLRGLAGWGVARGYHLMALPFASRRARVLADWTPAALFRRDVAELTIPSPREQGT